MMSAQSTDESAGDCIGKASMQSEKHKLNVL
jgi:hypothetical protein